MRQDKEKALAMQGEGNDTRELNQMSDNIVPTGNESTFDQIKQTREDGSEFWSARDLSAVMGYPRWADFQNPLDRAKSGAHNQGHAIENHFRRSPKVIEGGRWGKQTVEDHELTRFAAYLVAMNGDPNKSQVAAAQAYFAIKTREAETAAPNVVALPSRAALAQMVLDAEKELNEAQSTIEAQKPIVSYHDKFVAERDDIITVDNFASQYGSTGPKVRALLKEKGVAVRRAIGARWSESAGRMVEEFEWRPRQGVKSSEWFELRPQHNAPRLHNGQVRQTMYVLQFRADDLAAKLGLIEPQMFGGDAA